MVVGFPSLSKQPLPKALASQASLSNPPEEIDSTPEKARRSPAEAPQKPRRNPAEAPQKPRRELDKEKTASRKGPLMPRKARIINNPSVARFDTINE